MRAWCVARVVPRQAERDARRRWSPIRPGRRACAPGRRHRRGHVVQRRVDVGAAASISPSVGGSECRWRSVSRTQPMSTEMRLRPGRSGPPHRQARTRSSHRRCRPRGTGPAPGSRGSSAVAPANDSRLLRAADDLRLDAKDACTPRVNSAALAASRVALVATMRTAVAPAPRIISAYHASAANVLPAPPARAGRSRPRPGRAGRSPSAGARRPAARRPGRRRRSAAAASWCRSRSPPPAVICPPASTAATHGPACHHCPDRSKRLRAERVHAGHRELVRGQRMQALHPVRHPASALRARRQRLQPGRRRGVVPPAQVVAVRRPLRATPARGRLASRSVHLPHPPAASSRLIAATARGQVR